MFSNNYLVNKVTQLGCCVGCVEGSSLENNVSGHETLAREYVGSELGCSVQLWIGYSILEMKTFATQCHETDE